jgi:hypothetical protein
MSRRFINSQFTTQVQDVTPDVKELSVPEEGALIMCEGILYVGVDNEWQRLYSSLPSGTNIGLFAQTGNATAITNTVTETTLINGGVGSLSIPANAFNVGDSFAVSMGGVVSSANNNTLRVRVKAGSIVLGDTGLITMPQTTNKKWDLEVRFTVRQIGAVGVASIACFGLLTYSKNASNAFEGADFSTVNNSTFDTTVPNTLNITAQWGTASTSNSIYSESFILNKTY